jgi:tRNA(Ile2) C34 agmatinyltransferase TiaS
MNRRTFLRTSATVALGTTVLAEGLEASDADAATTRSGALRYRGSRDGKIFVSKNDGRTWKLLTDFGSDLSIPKVAADRHDRVVATLTYRRREFQLALQDDHRTWCTLK